MTDVKLSVEEGLARLTLARPDAGNAIDRGLVSQLRAHAEALRARADVRCVVLAGQGRNFCVGGDLAFFDSLDDVEAEIRDLAHDFHAGIQALRELDAPVVAAVQGAAAGGGLSLACASDIVVAAESARFTVAYTAAGLSPDGGCSWFLPRVVGYRLAAELLLSNRLLSATEAAAAGIVTRVVPDAELDAATLELAGRLVNGATHAYGSVKRLLQSGAVNPLDRQLEAEAIEIAANAAGPDGREGVAAFLAKRPARFGQERSPAPRA
jgi:2-(1,2-epoxy-1,2-dihydrophenyl)acetyl-CoA isomerase